MLHHSHLSRSKPVMFCATSSKSATEIVFTPLVWRVFEPRQQPRQAHLERVA